MTAKELNEGVQFTVDGNNQVTSVVVNADLWRNIVRALEETQEQEFVGMLKERVQTSIDVSSLMPAHVNEDWA